VVFATHALSPAKVSRITVLDPLEKHMEVIVDDSQLSLAIGKKGQNVRLAAKLLGWKIDIKSEEEKRQEVESQMAALVQPGAPVSVLLDYGLAESIVGKLVEAGVGTIEKLGSMTPEQLQEHEIGPDAVANLQDAVNAYYSQFEDPIETPVEEVADAPVAEEVEAAVAVEESPTEEAEVAEQSGTIEDAETPQNNGDATSSPEQPEEPQTEPRP
jgi:N utilization substance protein A